MSVYVFTKGAELFVRFENRVPQRLVSVKLFVFLWIVD
jgi:hypothetical protein